MEIKNILACDTSTSTLHLALVTEEGCEERMIKGGFQHSEDLLAEILSILKRRNLEIKDIDLLVCTRGPGSFTSLRISFATFKGFSSALGIPMVSVPTLEAIALAYSFPSVASLSVIDAKKKRYYLGLYKDGKKLCDDIDGNFENIQKVVEREERLIVTGPDAEAFSKQITSALPSLPLIVDTEERPLGLIIAKMGIKQFEETGSDDIGQGPVYIRRSDAEEALLAKKMESEK